MFRPVTLVTMFVMLAVFLPAMSLQAITCSLSTDQTEYRGGDDMIVSLGVDIDRATAVDVYFSLSVANVSMYWDGQAGHGSPFPWVAGVPIPQGLRFSGVPIFALPQLPFGLPDSQTVGDYTWRFEMKEGPQVVADCSAPFTFTCGGGIRNCGQSYLEWLPPCVRIVSASAPTDATSAGPFAVQVVLESACPAAGAVTIPTGLMFCSQTLETQNLVIIADFTITLSPGETRTVVLPAYCVDLSWHVPEGEYRIGSLAPGPLMSLVNYVKTKNVPQQFDSPDPNAAGIMFGVQGGIWGLTDECESLESVLKALDLLFSPQ